MKNPLKKHMAKLLNHILVGLMAYSVNMAPLEARVWLGIVDPHREN